MKDDKTPMRMRGAPQRRPLLPAPGGNLLTQNIAVDSTETIARKYLYICILSICDMSRIEKKRQHTNHSSLF